MVLKHIPPEKKILDIGSGAGLPGLLIAILQPRSHITMSEKNQKKAYFIKKTIQTLNNRINGMHSPKVQEQELMLQLLQNQGQQKNGKMVGG